MVALRHLLRSRLLLKLRPFLLWLGCFYACWAALVFLGGHVRTVAEHWPIAVAMALGSYFAGSTPMGGGTVGFPVLVLLFNEPAEIGRNFSFAVQSIGMVSASIFILTMRRPLAWRFLIWCMAASLIVTPISAALLAPRVSGVFVKLLFAVVWASFGVMHFVRVNEFVRQHGFGVSTPAIDRMMGVLCGALGGVIASITGVGIDMLLYAVLVIMCRADLKIAIPTSVIVMAFTSLVGLVSNYALGTIQPEVFANWLAAAPVVALGAPLGALIVHYMPRKPTLLIVSALCIGQFVWTCVHERVSLGVLAMALAGVLAFNGLFHLMRLHGLALQRRAAMIEAGQTESPSSLTPGA